LAIGIPAVSHHCFFRATRDHEAAGPAPPGADNPFVHTCHILLADDSADHRQLLSTYLRGRPVAIEAVANGADAAERARHRSYDLIVMDVQMPVLGGYDATRAIRRGEVERAAPAVPILALTASHDDDEPARSREAGCTELLTKPVSMARFLDAVARLGCRPPAAEPGSGPAVRAEVLAAFAAVVPDYLRARGEDADRVDRAVERGDFDTVRVTGHNLKGSGASYGFSAITDIGRALEAGALERDAAVARREAERLRHYVAHVLVDYV
jgi:CheY-like chemotaxis protein